MKILHILPALESGGTERGVVDLSIANQRAGHSVHVSSSGGKLTATLNAAGIPHTQGPWQYKNPCTWLQRARHLGNFIQQHSFDIVHAHSRIPCWLTHLSRRYHNSAVVTTCHATHGMGPYQLKYHYNKAVVLGDSVIATSKTVKNYLQHYFPHRIPHIQHIPRGSCTDDFIDNPKRTAALHQTWQLDDRPMILFPARISPRKGQHLLIEALAATPNLPPLQIIFVGHNGHPKYLNQVLKMAQPHQQKHRIAYLGQHHDLASAYHLSDIVVNATIEPEPFGRIPVEAGLAQRCTIAPNEGGFQETILHQQTGWLFTPNSGPSLGQQLLHFLQLSNETRQRHEARCYAHMMANFTLEKMAQHTLTMYQQLLNSQSQ